MTNLRLIHMLLFLIVGATAQSPTANASSCGPLYQEYLYASSGTRHRLVDTAVVDVDGSIRRVSFQVGPRHTEIGYLNYSLVNRNSQLVIDYVFAHEKFRGLQIAQQMFAKVLSEHPQVVTMTGVLAETNLVVYKQGLEDGLSPLSAVKLTPAYKLRLKLGFPTVKDSDLLPSLQQVLAGGHPLLTTSK